jgi:predicted lysophospholipase L1 biosynthesis ABC-type transport system permease subunit
MKEMAIRQSMGASRRHVANQIMVETVLLTALGGLLGLVVGASGIRLLGVLGADRLPLGAHIAFNGRLAAIGLAVAVLLGVVIAMPIAWFNLRSHLENALRSESRTGTVSRAAQRLRHGFIVAQIAIAFVLLTGATLLGLSLKNVMAVSPGFAPITLSPVNLCSRMLPFRPAHPNASLSSIAYWKQSGNSRELPRPERLQMFR